MQEQELRVLVEQMVATVARIDQRCERLEQQLPVILDDKTERWLQTTSGQIENVARAGLESPLAEGRRSVQGISAEADQTAKTLQVARRDVGLVLRWVWIGAATSLVLSLIALVGTYEMVYGYYHDRVAQVSGQMDTLEAVNRSDVVRCEEGRLCARIDDRSPRVGDKKQYRLIELRP